MTAIWGLWCARKDGSFADWLRQQHGMPPIQFDSQQAAEAEGRLRAHDMWLHEARPLPVKP
jgi:hypothetical protein